MSNIKIKSALKISGIYFLFSSLWIYLSDFVLQIFINNVDDYTYLSSIKGTVFVLVSSLIIYSVVKRETRNILKASIMISDLELYDPLTRLYNRKSFENEIKKIASNNYQATVIMTDINGLRIINTLFSFENGNEFLINYSKTLKNLFPKNTFIARLGGDEFVVILRNCDFESATKMVETLRREVNDNNPICTTSIGYSSTCLDKHDIYDSLKLSEERLQKDKLLSLNSTSSQIITTLKATLFEKSDETESHASRMEIHVVRIADKLKLGMVAKNDLKLLAILHDIGKIGIDDSILKKTTSLTEDEWIEMRQHSSIGYNIASTIKQLEPIAYYILTHHERFDGSGYPHGLKGDQIPLLSRIIAVVDAYDAMTNDRVYRKALSKEDAIKEIILNKGSQFDPSIVEVFIDIIK